MAAERLLLLLSEARHLKRRVKNAPATPDQWLYAPRISTPKKWDLAYDVAGTAEPRTAGLKLVEQIK
jgi:hypothetical protein